MVINFTQGAYCHFVNVCGFCGGLVIGNSKKYMMEKTNKQKNVMRI